MAGIAPPFRLGISPTTTAIARRFPTFWLACLPLCSGVFLFVGAVIVFSLIPLVLLTPHHPHTVEAIPLRLVWMMSLFLLCGGGNYGAEMLLAVILVNSTSETYRYIP